MRRNLSFLVDVSKLRDCQDVKSDMNGVYHITLRKVTWTVQVGASNHVEILGVFLKSVYMHQDYSANKKMPEHRFQRRSVYRHELHFNVLP